MLFFLHRTAVRHHNIERISSSVKKPRAKLEANEKLKQKKKQKK